MARQEVLWSGPVPETDDFGSPITNTFYDAKTRLGSWATMAPASWATYGYSKLGLGYGQKYVRQSDGRWLKVKG